MIDVSRFLELLPAYIDPGAGSFFIQLIIGTILAVPYLLRTQLARAWRAIRRTETQEPDHPGEVPTRGMG